MMARTIILAAFLTLSAAPAFACGNAMKNREAETPEAEAPRAKEAPQEAPPANLALLGLAGVGLAGLAGAFALRSRS